MPGRPGRTALPQLRAVYVDDYGGFAGRACGAAAARLARRAGWKGVSAVRVQKGRERAAKEGLDCWRCSVLGGCVGKRIFE